MVFRDQCSVGQKLKRPSKVFLGKLRVMIPIVRLVNQVPVFQHNKEIYRMNLQDVIFILGQRVAGVGHFFSLISTDKCCCRRKKRAIRLWKVCYFVKWEKL